MTTKNCEKCGNPKKMYWCVECESSSEYPKCDNRSCKNYGKKITLDTLYHEDCPSAGTDYSSMSDKELMKLSGTKFEELSGHLDDEDIETLNELLEMERELTLREGQ